MEAGARRLRPPKRGSLETERGKTGTGGRGRVRGAGGIKGVARQRAVSTASPSEARMGRRGSDAALSEGRTARRAGLVNAHRWKEGRKRTATGDALNAAFRLNRENRVCLEAEADSLLLHFGSFVSVDLRFDFPRSRRAGTTRSSQRKPFSRHSTRGFGAVNSQKEPLSITHAPPSDAQRARRDGIYLPVSRP